MSDWFILFMRWLGLEALIARLQALMERIRDWMSPFPVEPWRRG